MRSVLRARDDTHVPVYVAAFDLPGYEGLDAVGMVATDLSDQYKPAGDLVESEKAARELLAASDRSRLALLSVVEDQSEAERSLRERTNELAQLYELSRALAAAETLQQVLDVVGETAVRMVHVTFARTALLDGDRLVVRAAHPVRILEHDLLVGDSLAIRDLPHCQRALAEHEAVLVRADDPDMTEAERHGLMLECAASLCIVPLRVGDAGQHLSQNLGVLMLGEARSPSREPFTPEKMRLAKSIGDQAAAAIRRMSLREQTDRRLRHLVALRTIDTAISGSFDLRTVLNVLLEQATLHLGADAASLLLLDPSTYTLQHFVSRGFRSDSVRRASIRLGEGPTGRAALESQPIRIPDLRTAPAELKSLSHFQGEDFMLLFRGAHFGQGADPGPAGDSPSPSAAPGSGVVRLLGFDEQPGGAGDRERRALQEPGTCKCGVVPGLRCHDRRLVTRPGPARPRDRRPHPARGRSLHDALAPGAAAARPTCARFVGARCCTISAKWASRM